MSQLQITWEVTNVGEPKIPIWTATLVRLGADNRPISRRGEWLETFGSKEHADAFRKGVEVACQMAGVNLVCPNSIEETKHDSGTGWDVPHRNLR